MLPFEVNVRFAIDYNVCRTKPKNTKSFTNVIYILSHEALLLHIIPTCMGIRIK